MSTIVKTALMILDKYSKSILTTEHSKEMKIACKDKKLNIHVIFKVISNHIS